MAIEWSTSRNTSQLLALRFRCHMLLVLSLMAGVSSGVDLGIFQHLRPEIFAGAKNPNPRTSYLPDRPPRFRVFKNGVLQENPYAEEKEPQEAEEEAFKGLWSRIDLDQDQVLSMDEFVRSMELPVSEGKMGKEDLPEMFNSADTDGSGDLTLEEVRTFLFKDQEKEPVVEEAEAVEGNEERFNGFWDQLDTNHNGIMDKEEFETSMRGAVESGHMPKEEMLAMFDRMDADGDGTVTKAEAKTEIQSQMKRHRESRNEL